MITKESFSSAFARISSLMHANRAELVRLDQVNGDGDLGISMDDGFQAVAAFFADEAPEDLGQALRQASKVMNSSAPSSLGTILAFGLMGMAKDLRGKSEITLSELASAIDSGVANIMEKAESKPGEKTILDALAPGASELVKAAEAGEPANVKEALTAAAAAARAGSESTKNMRAVHGRAAYSAERSVGILDGGSVAGALIFEGIAGE